MLVYQMVMCAKEQLKTVLAEASNTPRQIASATSTTDPWHILACGHGPKKSMLLCSCGDVYNTTMRLIAVKIVAVGRTRMIIGIYI